MLGSALVPSRGAPPAGGGSRRRRNQGPCCAFSLPSFGRQVQQMLAQQQVAPRVEVQLLSPQQTAHTFRVATFNILADGLAQTGDFVKVPISCLQWEHRLPLILQEIRAANADIVCLQELNHFDTLAAALIPQGYSAFFRAKTPSPALKYGFPADGIALFYRHARFAANPPPQGHCFASSDGQPVAQGFVTASLRDKQSGRHLLVAATHLKAKAGCENEQTRTHQAMQLLRELEHMQERQQQLQQLQQPPVGGNGAGYGSSSNGTQPHAQPRPPAVVLCGDFNTTPDSDTVQTIKQHDLGLQSIWDVPWSSSSSSSNGNGNGARASSSAIGGNGNGKHGHAPPGDAPAAAAAAAAAALAAQAAEFTTWKFRSSGAAKRTIDYIWYSRQQLAPVSRWRMLSEEEIGPEGLPSRSYPSDHMCVACEFGWLD